MEWTLFSHVIYMLVCGLALSESRENGLVTMLVHTQHQFNIRTLLMPPQFNNFENLELCIFSRCSHAPFHQSWTPAISNHPGLHLAYRIV